jgi:hypothetical protein
LFVFGAVWVAANTLTAADRTYTLPCEIGSFSPSADGTTVWIGCFELPKPGKASPDFGYDRNSVVYALDTASGQLTEIARSTGGIFFAAAPVGAKVVVSLTAANTENAPTLYERSRKIAAFSAEALYPSWTPDAKKLMYLTSLPGDQSPLPKLLGIVNVDDLAISKVRLAVPTELLFTCRENGHHFTGDIAIDRSGHLKVAGADEYGPDFRYLGRNAKIPPGDFSATCRYVATPSLFHGPVPWEIVDTATGRQLMYSDFTGESKKPEYESVSWNPKHEGIFLRRLHLPGDPRGEKSTLQIFDPRSGRVVESMASAKIAALWPEAQWSSDGNWLMSARGQSLIFHPTPN